jgi:SAM-dependent methyltransferase
MHERNLGLGQHSSAFGEGGIRKRLTALASLTELTGERLLDVGCANGSYTMRLAERFDRVDAVDVEPERLEEFRETIAGTPLEAKITVQHMSADALEFADDTFDVVTTIEVLEHVNDLDRAIAEIHRVLKPGGRFLVTTPNRLFPFETHGFIVRGKRYRPAAGPFLPWIVPLHTRLADARCFTAGGLTRQVEAAGFCSAGHTYVMPPFDRSKVGRVVKPVTEAMEHSRLKVFGMALVLAFTKAEAPQPA